MSCTSARATAGRRSRSRAPIPTWCASCSRWRSRRSRPGRWRSPRSRARPATAARSRWTARNEPGVNAKGYACIGPMGSSRVRNVMAELHGEEDRTSSTTSPEPGRVLGRPCAVARAGCPRSSSWTPQANRVAQVIVPDYQLSLAIGKEGQNVRLAARLTGWRIDIQPDSPGDGHRGRGRLLRKRPAWCPPGERGADGGAHAIRRAAGVNAGPACRAVAADAASTVGYGDDIVARDDGWCRRRAGPVSC